MSESDDSNSPHMKAWDALRKEIEAETRCRFILLDDPFDDEENVPPKITRDYLLGREHILLPKDAGRTAWKIFTDVNNLRFDWDYGDTSLGNAVWDNHMIPQLQKAEQMVSLNKWRKAFGILFGILLAGSYDGLWIHDQEIYCDFDEFSGWFADYSKAWKKVLEKTDKQLGLVCEGGNVNGYRNVVTGMIKNWERETNTELKEFDRFAGDHLKARVHIFSADSDVSDEDNESFDENDDDCDVMFTKEQ